MTPLSRRWVLRGLGAAIALPLLDAMLPSRGHANAPVSPRRFVTFYFPNGRERSAWVPSATGVGHDLPASLAPLAPIAADVRVLTNLLAHEVGYGHETSSRSALSPVEDGESFGASVDVLLARHLGGDTASPLLALASEPVTRWIGRYHWRGYVSWSARDTPIPRDTVPAAVFDRLFAVADPDAPPSAWRRASGRSILDGVVEQANALRSRLGSTDQATLDSWLTSLRELERGFATPVLETCDLSQLPPRTIADHDEHIRTMTDLTVLALACDRSRVVTYMAANEGSEFPLVDLGLPSNHHAASHGEIGYAEATTWYVERYARLVQRLAEHVDASGVSLLDQSYVLGLSAMGDGASHSPEDCAVLLAGRGGTGALRAPGHTRFASGDALAGLHLSLLQAFGEPSTRFGRLGERPLLDLR
jgi:hypothetical protein